MQSEQFTSQSISLVKAEYLIAYIRWLRQLGAPVDRELRRARLPVLIEEMPEQFISHDLAFRFLGHCIRLEGIDDIGFEAGWTLTHDDISEYMNHALSLAPTLISRIDCFVRLLRHEDTGMSCGLRSGGEMTRIWVQQYIPAGADSRIAEWQNLKAVIEILRRQAGPDWLPNAIGFKSPLRPSQSVQDRLGNIELLSGQDESWVMVPSRLLHLPIEDRLLDSAQSSVVQHSIEDGENLLSYNFIEHLRAALIPYLSAGHPPIDLAAEIAGTSVRSLQRRLGEMQTSYLELVERVRFDQAILLLRDSNLNILDIAFTLGYHDSSNFGRAVRRISGVSPSQLRRELLH